MLTGMARRSVHKRSRKRLLKMMIAFLFMVLVASIADMFGKQAAESAVMSACWTYVVTRIWRTLYNNGRGLLD